MIEQKAAYGQCFREFVESVFVKFRKIFYGIPEDVFMKYRKDISMKFRKEIFVKFQIMFP
jgi:hypothetical protein